MGRKVKRKREPRTQRVSREPRLAGLGPLLPVGAVIGVIVLAICGLEYLRGQVLSAPEYNPPPEIELEYLPGAEWVRDEGWLPRITASVKLSDQAVSSDDLLGAVVQQLRESGWVRSVETVTRDMDGTIRAVCDYRRPIAMILTRQGKYIPVDREGVRLPEQYDRVDADSGWMRIIGVQTEPPPIGRSYADLHHESDAVAAIRLAVLLFDQQDIGDYISGIDVSNFNGRRNKFQTHISLYARDGRSAGWGSAIGREVEEPSLTDKLRNLALWLRTPSPQAYADLTVYRDGVLVPMGK